MPDDSEYHDKRETKRLADVYEATQVASEARAEAEHAKRQVIEERALREAAEIAVRRQTDTANAAVAESERAKRAVAAARQAECSAAEVQAELTHAKQQNAEERCLREAAEAESRRKAESAKRSEAAAEDARAETERMRLQVAVERQGREAAESEAKRKADAAKVAEEAERAARAEADRATRQTAEERRRREAAESEARRSADALSAGEAATRRMAEELERLKGQLAAEQRSRHDHVAAEQRQLRDVAEEAQAVLADEQSRFRASQAKLMSERDHLVAAVEEAERSKLDEMRARRDAEAAQRDLVVRLEIAEMAISKRGEEAQHQVNMEIAQQQEKAARHEEGVEDVASVKREIAMMRASAMAEAAVKAKSESSLEDQYTRTYEATMPCAADAAVPLHNRSGVGTPGLQASTRHVMSRVDRALAAAKARRQAEELHHASRPPQLDAYAETQLTPTTHAMLTREWEQRVKNNLRAYADADAQSVELLRQDREARQEREARFALEARAKVTTATEARLSAHLSAEAGMARLGPARLAAELSVREEIAKARCDTAVERIPYPELSPLAAFNSEHHRLWNDQWTSPRPRHIHLGSPAPKSSGRSSVRF